MTNTEIIATMSRCVCGTRIQWTQNPDNSTHRGVVDEFHPENGVEDAYLAVILKSAEMDRVADAFSGYIHRHPSLDLVWSEKAGYVLMTINPDKQRGEDYCSFRTAHDLAFRLFSEVETDVVLECEDCDDVSSMDDEGRKEVQQRWAPFLEMLPEHKSICEDILAGNKAKYSE